MPQGDNNPAPQPLVEVPAPPQPAVEAGAALQDIAPGAEIPQDFADANTSLERAVLENQKLRAEVQTLTQNNAERKKYASHLFWLVASWLACVMIVLIVQASWPKTEKKVDSTNASQVIAEHYRWGFNMPDAIVMALIGTTSVNVLGLFVIVAKFSSRQHAIRRPSQVAPPQAAVQHPLRNDEAVGLPICSNDIVSVDRFAFHVLQTAEQLQL